MSNMIECDGCKAKMYTDCRSDKGDYHSVWIDQTQGYHLCRICYEAFMRNILRRKWSDDEQQWVPVDKGNGDQPTVTEGEATTAKEEEFECPYYMGVCGLDRLRVCYCKSDYKHCDTYQKYKAYW